MTTAQRTTANRIIRGKGQAISIAGTASAAYVPGTGVTNTAYTATGWAVLLPLSKARKVDGTNIKQGDETLLISGLDSAGAALTEPPANSIITLADTTTVTLIAIDRLNPEGAGAILFDAVVRRTA